MENEFLVSSPTVVFRDPLDVRKATDETSEPRSVKTGSKRLGSVDMRCPLRVADELSEIVELRGRPFGIEAHRFLVGWYNEQVAPQFQLPYDPSTLAFLMISTPSMFEKAFMPFVRAGFKMEFEEEKTGVESIPPNSSESCSEDEDDVDGDESVIGRRQGPSEHKAVDPVDRCCCSVLRHIASHMSPESEVITDFDMVNRRPRILVQTMGHVSGAAYFYQRKDLLEEPFTEEELRQSKQRLLGVSIHPLYGGWFAFRGAIIMRSVLCPELSRKPCVDVVPDESRRAWLLREFNYNWKDWKYRDVIPVCSRYSLKQREYFATLPCDRERLLESYREGSPAESSSDSN